MLLKIPYIQNKLLLQDKIQFIINLLKFSPHGMDAAVTETRNDSLSFNFVSLLNLCFLLNEARLVLNEILSRGVSVQESEKDKTQ